MLQYPSLFTTDPRAVNHILTHSDKFQKPQEAKAALEILGEGARSVVISNIFRVNFLSNKAWFLLRVRDIANK